MAMQSIGNFGGIMPQPAPSAGSSPKPVVPSSGNTSADAVPQAILPSQQPSREQVQQAVEAMRKSMSEVASSNLQFAIDNDTGETIVRVTDRKTGELIRQIPSQELLELAKSIDRMQGLLLQQKA